jgi:hypothetical protein
MPNDALYERQYEVTHAVVRSEEIDISALKETMWPRALEYFGRHTAFLELVVGVEDVFFGIVIAAAISKLAEP